MRNRSGFTLIELLVVVAVIGILASIGIVSYAVMRKDAHDAQIIDGAQKIADAIEVWHAKTSLDPASAYSGSSSTGPLTTTTVPNGSTQETCTGTGGTGEGWIAKSAGYGCALEELLVAGNYLPEGYMDTLPKNTKWPSDNGKTYMIEKCNDTVNPTDYVLLYTLEAPTNSEIKQWDDVTSQCTGTGSPDFNAIKSSFNMQGARLINFTR